MTAKIIEILTFFDLQKSGGIVTFLGSSEIIFITFVGMNLQPDHKALIELAHAKMHFGKYKGKYLSELPEFYLVWFRQKGFPKNKLGQQMEQVLDLKVNGMEQILRTIRYKYPL